MGALKFKSRFWKKTSLFFAFFITCVFGFSQELLNPLTKDKSHESLNISSIIIADTATIVNIVFDGKNDSLFSFCADKNSYIQDYKNDFRRFSSHDKKAQEVVSPKKMALISKENIKACAEKTTVKYAKDSLEFKLIFPKLNKPLIGFIDLISDNFRFEGICLNDSLAYEVSTYQQAFAEFEDSNKDTAIVLFKKIIDFHDTTNNMYENAFFNIPIIYESKGDKKKAITWYKKLLESELTDDELLEEGKSTYGNFKHRSCLRLAAIYKSMGKFQESVEYLWLADTAYSLKDTSAAIKSKQNALLLLDKIQCYDSLKAYDQALFYGIKQIINEETPNFYNAQSKMLVEMIKEKLDYKKFVADFDKALQQLIVFDEENQVTGKFKFLDKDYELKISKDYAVLVFDPKTKQLVKGNLQDKNQAFFIQRVKISDFYLKLKSKT